MKPSLPGSSVQIFTYRIEGRVVDSLSRAALPGLRVEVWGKDTNAQITTGETELDGHFSFSLEMSVETRNAAATSPVVYFKVFEGTRLLKETGDAPYQLPPTGDVSGGRPSPSLPLEIEVELPAEPSPSHTPSPSSEVVLHELGESLAATVASVQNELARYNTALGTYVLDEVELNVPVLLRVSGFGQVMATVTQTSPPDAAVGQIRLRLKPAAGANTIQQLSSVGAKRSLDSLGALSREMIERLEGERIFCVGDLLRVASNASGRMALSKNVFGGELSEVLDRATVLSLPIPAVIGEALLKLGFSHPARFLQTNPADLADTLSRSVELLITAKDIEQWQEASAIFLDTLPSYRPVSGTNSNPRT